MSLKDFGSITMEAIDAVVGPAHDAAVHSRQFRAEELGIWRVEVDTVDDKPAVVITIFAG